MERPKTQFHAFDPDAETSIRERNLPHWFQPGAATFITFRTIDSLPNDVIIRFQRELAEWLITKGLPSSLSSWDTSVIPSEDLKQFSSIPQKERAHFRRLRDRLFHRELDACHGECLLKRHDLAMIVHDAILYFDGSSYDLDSFVIMPNHVHVIVQFRPGSDLSIVGQSWMRYTARQINKRLGRIGGFWQQESFDHLIRSDDHFRFFQGYIKSNPVQAMLPESSYIYWSCDC